jgi:hypothetical protein
MLAKDGFLILNKIQEAVTNTKNLICECHFGIFFSSTRDYVPTKYGEITTISATNYKCKIICTIFFHFLIVICSFCNDVVYALMKGQ